MNTINVPGFTAEASLHEMNKYYAMTSSTITSNADSSKIVPQSIQVCFPWPCEDIFGRWHVCGICYIIKY